MEWKKDYESIDIIRALLAVIDKIDKERNKKASFQISADTEEGKQLIKNLIEMQNKKS